MHLMKNALPTEIFLAAIDVRVMESLFIMILLSMMTRYHAKYTPWQATGMLGAFYYVAGSFNWIYWSALFSIHSVIISGDGLSHVRR